MVTRDYYVGQELYGSKSDGEIVEVRRNEDTGQVRAVMVQWDSEPYPTTYWFDSDGWTC